MTDIHMLAGAAYPQQPPRPFRTATTEEIRGAAVSTSGSTRITPANDADLDVTALQAYKDFRSRPSAKGCAISSRYSRRTFRRSAPAGSGRFLNDFVVRTLAGIPGAGRPLFLKLPYHGPRAMEELAAYDPHLVPGMLGGSSGTTYDAFFLLEDARRHGARAAMFGRKIKDSDHPLSFVRQLRAIADGEVEAGEACRAYHADLDALGIRPRRPLDEDLQLTQQWNG